VAVVEKVLGLYGEKYFDLNVRHFHEKLQEEHQVEISYSWVKGILQGAGMVAKGRKRGVHRQQRPLPGMLLHIDGSEHRWFQDERWYDLLQPGGAFYDFYQGLLTKGMEPAMARLTLARKIAAITLIVWKKGARFDAEQLKPQAA
jgi:hypothetical protein